MASNTSTSIQDVRPGNYELHTLDLINYAGEKIDISSLVYKFSVVESINSMFCVYEFVIIDAVNLLEKYIITGNEKIKMTLLKKDTPDSDQVQIEKSLVVAGISDYAKPSNEGQAYKLKAISETAFACTNLRITRSVNGTASDIVQQLFSEVVNDESLNVLSDPDVGNFKAVLPNYSYIDTIMMLLTRAQRTDGSMYYLFETLFNDFFLTSYQEIVSRSSFDTYKLLSEEQGGLFTKENFNYNRTRIESINSKLGVSHFEGMKLGAYNARVHALDISKKNYEVIDYSVLDQPLPKLDSDYILDSGFSVSNKSVSDFVEPKMYFVNENSMAYEGGENLNNRYKTSIAQRNAIAENQYAVTHTVTLNGDTRIRAGEVIELDIPPATHPDLLPDDRRDLLMSGRYFVSSIIHEFDMKSNYKIKATVRKDSIDRGSMQGKYKYLESR